jgi:hypothetical protein
MTRKLLLVALGAALAVLVVVSGVWWFVPIRPGVMEAKCARIRPGMRLEEVAAVMGGPPGVYHDQGHDQGQIYVEVDLLDPPRTGQSARWLDTSEGLVTVYFSESGAVDRSEFAPARKPTLLEWLRRLFH